jgi:TQXA domain-containing protein
VKGVFAPTREVGVRTRRRGQLIRILLAAVAVVLLLASPAFAVWEDGALPPDGSTPADLVMTGTAQGRGGLLGGLAPSTFDPLNGYPDRPPAGSVPENVDFAGLITAQPIPPGPEVLLYCIDLTTPTSPGVRYALGQWNSANVPNVGYVAQILNSYYPNTNEPASLSNANDKAAAVQAAIWYFSDKYVLDRFQPRRADVAAIVQHVIDIGPVVNPNPPTISITPPAEEGPTGSYIGPFTLNTTAPAQVTATGGDLFADSSGSTPLTNPVADGTQFWARRSSAGDVDVSATAAVTVPSGNVYLPTRQAAQKLILAQSGTVSTTVHATATAYDVGNLQVTKSISGAGAAQRSGVALAVTCTDGSTGSIAYPAGSPPTPPLLVEDIRAGSQCTVIEVVDGANDLVSVTTTFTPGNEVTIAANTTTDVGVSNVYAIRTGAVRVTKVVTGADVDQRGAVVVNVTCTDGTNEDLTFPAGVEPTPQTVDGIAAGSTCTTTEPDDGGNPPTVEVITTIEPSAPVTIVAGETAEVVVSNQYESGIGSLVVQKDTEGLDELRGDVTIRAECDNGSSAQQTYPRGTVSPAIVIDPLPIGTQCTITEPQTGENALVDVTTDIEPAATVTITGPQPPVVVGVVNTYTPKPGTVSVRKSIAGPGAALHDDVVVVVACEDGQIAGLRIPAGAPGPRTASLTNVPAGADCGVVELADGSNAAVNASVTGLPDGLFVILPAEDRTIDVVDTYAFNAGTVTVTKAISGPLAAQRTAVTVSVACSNGVTTSRTFAPGVDPSPITLSGLPAFATCRIEEPVNGEATGVGAVTKGAPQTVTVAPGATTAAVVQNIYVPVEVKAETITNGGPDLARTGTDPWPLARLGLLALGIGAALLGALHLRRRRLSLD